MFGIGMPELIVILVVALVVLGPDKLPELARSIGKGLSAFKKAADDIKGDIVNTVDEHGKDVKKHLPNIPSPSDDWMKPVSSKSDAAPAKEAEDGEKKA